MTYRFHVSSDKKEHVHLELYRYLIAENKAIIAQHFNLMREMRIDCDYFFQKTTDSKLCDKMFRLHDKIVDHLEVDAPY
jgi:hypothetical protein